MTSSMSCDYCFGVGVFDASVFIASSKAKFDAHGDQGEFFINENVTKM